MAGAGVLPGRAAAEAARQGWRVVALAFDEAAGLDAHAERVVAISRSLGDPIVNVHVDGLELPRPVIEPSGWISTTLRPLAISSSMK